ncbi:hypothetical protein [Patulibacter minatonensis]|uniref:hypothetical protein n=1 Tax=Patulibacter minatonensis TaxID=298163 RepID=UPI00047D332F|nr:hypothetical protein [Patulibacter minatonensis]
MSTVLDRLPALATTGVGSLPFDDRRAAVRHATRAYGIPFCPQLPRHDGDMVREWLGAEWSAAPCGWTTERDRERPAAWDAFVAAVADRAPEHRVVKLQATGPVTLAVAMERAAGRPGVGADVIGLATEIAGWLASNVAGQVARMRDLDLDLDVLLLVDEPGLAHAAIGGGDVWDPLRGAAAAWGLHVCSSVPWGLVRDAAPDVLSFDATRYPVDPEGAAVLADLVDGGGRIAWGAVDPVRPDTEAAVAARLAACIGAVSAAGPSVRTLVEHSLVTPSCGTGRLGADRERLLACVVDAAAEDARRSWRSWPRPESAAARARG